jgi:hypothetical protein
MIQRIQESLLRYVLCLVFMLFRQCSIVINPEKPATSKNFSNELFEIQFGSQKILFQAMVKIPPIDKDCHTLLHNVLLKINKG